MGEAYENEKLAADYKHQRHAGNVGDVWKHAVLCSIYSWLREAHPQTAVFETHAGEGRYSLHASGEWREGIGRFINSAADRVLPKNLLRYRELVLQGGFPDWYPGSPLIAQSLLDSNAELTFCDIDIQCVQAMRAAVIKPQSVIQGDGLEHMSRFLAAHAGSSAFLLIDPPWTRKQDWSEIPRALSAAWKLNPHLRIALWYPIKSYTRVNVVIKMLQAEGVPAAALDLITYPLRFRRNRLNGSGMLLINIPASVYPELNAAAAIIGDCCAVRPGEWEFRINSWAAN